MAMQISIGIDDPLGLSSYELVVLGPPGKGNERLTWDGF